MKFEIRNGRGTDDELDLCFSRNGYQWSAVSLTPKDLLDLVLFLNSYFSEKEEKSNES